MKRKMEWILLATIFLTGCSLPPDPTLPIPTPANQKLNTEIGPTARVAPTPTTPDPTPEVTATVEPTLTPLPTRLAPGFPPQPEGVPFPAAAWPVGPWPEGVDRARIDKAVDTAFADGGEARVRAVVIVHGGQMVYERYSPNPEDGPDVLMPGYSIAKSITSALAGILVRDGLLDVLAPAEVPEWHDADDPRQAITVDDLMRMSSGLEWDQGDYPNLGDQGPMLSSDDAAAYAADKPLLHEPGSEFLYSSGNTLIVDRILAGKAGTGQAFRRFMRTELLDKIGIKRINLDFDASGTWIGAHAASASARDFARFGLLYLRDGVWNGERILPEGWVDYSRMPSLSNPEYGAGWWLDLERPGVFYAIGISGQTIAVDPAHDLTFVTLATDSRTSLPVAEAILNAFAGQE